MKTWLLALIVATLLTSCKPPEKASGHEAAEKIKMGLLPKKKGVPYFTSCSEGAMEAAKELGDVEFIYDGPTDGSAEKAASLIERWTLQGVNVIAVSPNDPEVVGPAMKAAREKGIKVITWDADAAPDTREFFVNQGTAKDIGYALVDAMDQNMGGLKGDVAIVTATLTAANQNEWIKYIKERLAHYPAAKLVAIKPSNEDQKLAFSVTQDLLKAYPNLKGVFAISSVAFPGAAEAVKQGGMAGKVDVVGLSTPNDMRAYVEDGTVKAVVLWDTKDLGYLTVQVGRALAKGELKPGATDFKAGRLGAKTISGDNVLLGKMLVFKKDNIGQYHF